MRNELKTRTLIEILMAGFNEMTDENCTNKRVSTEETLAKSPEAEFKSSSENVNQPPGKKKKCGKTLARSKPLQAPAPFSTDLYCMFVKAIKNGGASYPSSRQLINLKFWSGPGTSHRKRFRRVLPKLRLQRVEGSVVFSANLEEDVLVLEKSRKIILPDELVERAILRAHHYGNNTANEHLPQRTNSLHLGVLKTFQIVCMIPSFNYELPKGGRSRVYWVLAGLTNLCADLMHCIIRLTISPPLLLSSTPPLCKHP